MDSIKDNGKVVILLQSKLVIRILTKDIDRRFLQNTPRFLLQRKILNAVMYLIYMVISPVSVTIFSDDANLELEG